MRFRQIPPKVFLIAVVVVLILAVKFYVPLKDFWSLQIEKLGIYADNFFSAVGPQMKRKRPLSMLMSGPNSGA
jgi:ABC-type transport system involved in cytochrome bd biosynthesis fused ATPase/permease subunit